LKKLLLISFVDKFYLWSHVIAGVFAISSSGEGIQSSQNFGEHNE